MSRHQGRIVSPAVGRLSGPVVATGPALENPGAVAPTSTGQVAWNVEVSPTGEVEEVLRTVSPRQDRGADAERMGLGGLLRIRAGGPRVTLEGRPADVRELVGSAPWVPRSASTSALCRLARSLGRSATDLRHDVVPG